MDFGVRLQIRRKTVTKPTINRRQLLGTAALGIAAVPLAGCTGVSRQDSQPHYVMVFDQNKCVGCGECKIACNETNKLPKGRSRLLMQLNGVKPDGSNKKDRCTSLAVPYPL